MRAVNIGIGHDDYLVIAQLFDVELIAYAGAQCHDERVELIVAVNFVGSGLFDIEHLAPHGKDGLKS